MHGFGMHGGWILGSVIIIAAGIALIRGLCLSMQSRLHSQPDATQQAAGRYARGEISEDEYRQISRVLEDQQATPGKQKAGTR